MPPPKAVSIAICRSARGNSGWSKMRCILRALGVWGRKIQRSQTDGIGSGRVTGRLTSTPQVEGVTDHVTDPGHVNGREIVMEVMIEHTTSDHIVAHALHLSTRKEDTDHQILGSEGSVYFKFFKGSTKKTSFGTKRIQVPSDYNFGT